jgi:sec-independent protein translocase protein TatC
MLYSKITPQKKQNMDNQTSLSQQSLIEHLSELRSCLIISLAAAAVGFAVAYSFIRPIADWFFQPLMRVLPADKSLIFISYQEGFFFT